MMQELLDWFLGAVHLYIDDPELLPVVDATCVVIVVLLVMATGCNLMIWALRLVFYALFGGSRNA